MNTLAFHVVRGVSLTIWGVVLFVGVGLLALSAFGIYLMFTPDGFMAGLLPYYGTIPGVIVTGLGASMFDRALRTQASE